MRSTLFILLCVGGVIPSAFGAEDDPAHSVLNLLDEKLHRQKIKLIGLGDASVGFMKPTESNGNTTWSYLSLPADKVVRIERPDAEAAEGQGVWLADGQKLVGQFKGVDDQGRLLWKTQAFDQEGKPAGPAVSLKLDDVLAFPGLAYKKLKTLPKVAATTVDRVYLANGDRLEGVIEALDSKVVKVSVGGNVVPVGWDTVAFVSVSNTRIVQPGIWLTTRSGSRFKLAGVSVEKGRLRGKAMGQALGLALADLVRLEFTTHHRLVPLADLKKQITGQDVFGTQFAPTFGRTNSLHAPLVVQFELPPGTQRFAAKAMLAEGPKVRRWADMVLRVADGKGVLMAKQLNGKSPEAAINVALRGGGLTLSLDEGVNGPIMDRLLLLDAAVLVKNKAP